MGAINLAYKTHLHRCNRKEKYKSSLFVFYLKVLINLSFHAVELKNFDDRIFFVFTSDMQLRLSFVVNKTVILF